VLELRRSFLHAPVGPAHKSSGTSKHSQQATPPGYSILIVEDEALIRITLREMLEDLGHKVVETGGIREAKEKLSAVHFDIMIVDLGLPDGSGANLVRETLDTHQHLSIVIASGRDVRNDVDHIPRDRRVRHMSKPYDETALKEALDQLQ
jgi:CheY-like chemotaxis protein